MKGRVILIRISSNKTKGCYINLPKSVIMGKFFEGKTIDINFKSKQGQKGLWNIFWTDPFKRKLNPQLNSSVLGFIKLILAKLSLFNYYSRYWKNVPINSSNHYILSAFLLGCNWFSTVPSAKCLQKTGVCFLELLMLFRPSSSFLPYNTSMDQHWIYK